MMKGCSGCINGKCPVKISAEKGAHGGPAAPIRQALTWKALVSGALAPLAPIFGFIAAYALTALLFPESSGDAERAAAGVLGLFLAGALVCLLRGKSVER